MNNRQKMNETSDFELQSKEMQEIIGRVPPWIVRSGITLVFLVVMLLLAGSWIFRYPDTIPASIIIKNNHSQSLSKSKNKNLSYSFDKEQLDGELYISSRYISRINIGQKVLIELDKYSYEDYGKITGIIDSVSDLPNENFYVALVGFPNGLITNYNKEISINDALKGSAEIVTEDIRFLQRILKPLTRILANNIE